MGKSKSTPEKDRSIDPAELLAGARVEKSGVKIGSKVVVAKDSEGSGDHILLEDAQVYFPDAKVGDTIQFPALWYFHLPYIDDRLPTIIGEHGSTEAEARERVLGRLQGIRATFNNHAGPAS